MDRKISFLEYYNKLSSTQQALLTLHITYVLITTFGVLLSFISFKYAALNVLCAVFIYNEAIISSRYPSLITAYCFFLYLGILEFTGTSELFFNHMWKLGVCALASISNFLNLSSCLPCLLACVTSDIYNLFLGKLPLNQIIFRYLINFMLFSFMFYLSQLLEQFRTQCEHYRRKLGKKSEKVSIKNRFIATLTHEMRNFVTVYFLCVHESRIVANSKTLQETATWNEETVNDLVQASTSLAEILNNTLDLSKLEEGKVEFNTVYQSINSAIDMVLSVARTNANNKGVRLEANYAKSLPEFIKVDKARLTQVVMNLVGNAVKFTPQDGHVNVSAKWLWKCDKEGDCDKCAGRAGSNQKEDLPMYVGFKKKDEGHPHVTSHSVVLQPERMQKGNMSCENLRQEIGENSLQTREQMFEQFQQPITFNYEKDQEEFETSPRVGLLMKKYNFMPYFKKPLACPSSTRVSAICSNFTEQTARVYQLVHKRNFTERSFYNDFSHLFPKESSEEIKRVEQPRQSKGKIQKLKNLKKSFYMTLGKNRMKMRNFKKAKAVIHTPTLQQASRKVSLVRECSYTIKRRQSNKGLEIRTQKDIEDRHYFCNYLMQPPSEGTLEIRVSDTGCGMAQEEIQKLFQPFAQANNSIFSKYGGTGLGLWLSNKLIRAMKGTISCESELSKGTTFIIRIPAKCKTGKDSQKTMDISLSSICKGLVVISLTKHHAELDSYLVKFGCTHIACREMEEMLSFLQKGTAMTTTNYVVLTGMKNAKLIKKQIKHENLPLKFSQIVIITSIFLLEAYPIEKVLHRSSFQYILKRPINSNIFLNVLTHIMRGLSIYASTSTILDLSTKIPEEVSTNAGPSMVDMNVLLIDDSDIVRKTLERQLKKYVQTVTECEDGLKGIMEYKQGEINYDFILVDYQMPELNGLKVIEGIRAHEDFNGLDRVTIMRNTIAKLELVLTGDDTDEIRVAGKNAGADYIGIDFVR